MSETSLLYPMKITKLADNDYYFTYPLSNISINGTEETFSSALETAKSALEFTLFDMLEDGEILPIVTDEEISKLDKNKGNNEHIMLIVTYKKEIYEKFGSKPVKKTLSIPTYQDHWLKEKNISLSKFVQENVDKAMSI